MKLKNKSMRQQLNILGNLLRCEEISVNEK